MTTLLLTGATGFFGKSILDAFRRDLLAPFGIGRIIALARSAQRLRGAGGIAARVAKTRDFDVHLGIRDGTVEQRSEAAQRGIKFACIGQFEPMVQAHCCGKRLRPKWRRATPAAQELINQIAQHDFIRISKCCIWPERLSQCHIVTPMLVDMRNCKRTIRAAARS